MKPALAALLLGLTAWMLWRWWDNRAVRFDNIDAAIRWLQDDDDIDWLNEFREPEWVRVA